MQKEEFDSQVQMVVERLYEDETLRGDLTDEESEALLSWASQTLISQLDKTFAKKLSDEELQAAPDKEYARVKEGAQAILELTKEKPSQDKAETVPPPAQADEAPKKTYTELTYTSLTEEKPASPTEQPNFNELFSGIIKSVMGTINQHNLDHSPVDNPKPATEEVKTEEAATKSTAAEDTKAKKESKADPVVASFEACGLSRTQVEELRKSFTGKSRLEKITLATELLNSIN